VTSEHDIARIDMGSGTCCHCDCMPDGSAKTSVFAVSAVALGSSVIGFGAAPVSQGVPPPSGSSLARLLMTDAFVVKTSLIPGFHTDATIELGSGLEIFLARVRFPLKRTYKARVLEPPLELPAVD
jgi:hypothetical protein